MDVEEDGDMEEDGVMAVDGGMIPLLTTITIQT